ncbi:MAG: cysteine desulfurase family protein [Myxococcota bacterium]
MADRTDPVPYLDHHATTPIDERVREAMAPYLDAEFGNAASTTHAFGWRAEAAVDLAREQVAELLGARDPREIVFTSGATESNNLAILGLADAARDPGHLVTVVTEHPAVLDPCRELARRGWDVTELPVDGEGRLSLEALDDALRDDTRLVSVMMANNEIGIIAPVADIAERCHARGIVFHTDAAQAVGKCPLHAGDQGLDLLSVSGHKLYGPKGVGVLRVRRGGAPRVKLAPRQFGGGHEGGLRSGTLPVALIVGLARALEIAVAEQDAEAERLAQLRDGLWRELEAALPGRVRWNGPREDRLPGNLNVSFEGLDGDRLLADLGGLAISSGSACSSARPEPSHVLLALGHTPALAKASLRIGFGRGNTASDVRYAADRILTAVRRQTGDG